MTTQHPCTCGLQATCMCDPKQVLNTGYLSITHNEVVSLRDQLAMAALPLAIRMPTGVYWEIGSEGVLQQQAEWAYQIADAMLEVRKK